MTTKTEKPAEQEEKTEHHTVASLAKRLEAIEESNQAIAADAKAANEAAQRAATAAEVELTFTRTGGGASAWPARSVSPPTSGQKSASPPW